MQIRNGRRPIDFRKCALIAALISAISVFALETAGGVLRGSYAGLEGTLSSTNTKGSLAVAPAGPVPR